jgi:transcription-repair coupling factor (superfamily II helicase)
LSPFSVLLKKVQEWKEKERGLLILSHTSGQAQRLGDLLSHYGVNFRLSLDGTFRQILDELGSNTFLGVGTVSSGFRNHWEGWVLLTEEEILGERKRLRQGRSRKTPSLASYTELREQDYVVHIDYGVGLYRGLRHLTLEDHQ